MWRAESVGSGVEGEAPCREERIELSRGRTGVSLRYGDWYSAVGLVAATDRIPEVNGRARLVCTEVLRWVRRAPSGREAGRTLRPERTDVSAGCWRSSREMTFALDLVMARPPSRRPGEARGSVRSLASHGDVPLRSSDTA